MPSQRLADLTRTPLAPGFADKAERIAAWTGTQDGHAVLVLRFQIDEPLEFLVYPEDGRAEAWWLSPTCRSEDVITLFHGPATGAILRARGQIVLHAGAAAVKGRAVTLLGASGSGKSTALAALARAGYPLLCDDMAVLTRTDDGFAISGNSEALKLWPDSADALEFGASTTATVHALTSKKLLAAERTQRSTLPVAAVAVMTSPGESADGEIERLDPHLATMTLMTQHYPPFLPLDRNERSVWFGQLGKLAATVPVFAVKRPPRFEGLAAFAARIAVLAEQDR